MSEAENTFNCNTCVFTFAASLMITQLLKTPLSIILKDGFFEERWFLTHSLDVKYVLEMPFFRFQVCEMSERSSRTPLFTISGIGSLMDRLFLTHFLDVGYVLKM